MDNTQNDLALLRQEFELMSRQIRRFSFLRLFILTIFVLTLTKGFEQTQSENIHDLEEKRDKITAQIRDKEKEPENHLGDELRKVNDELELKLKEAFTLSLNIFGSSLELDTRSWVYSFPFLLMLSQVYLQLLYKKQKMIDAIACERIRMAEAKDVSIIDRLAFSKTPGVLTAYSRYPYKLVTRFIDLCLLIVLAYFAFVGWKTYGDTGLLKALVPFFALVSIYLIRLYAHLSKKLADEVSNTFEFRAQYESVRTWKKIKTWTQSKIGHRFNRSSLLTGSTLILLSLFLSVSGTCMGPNLKGYEVITEGGMAYYTAVEDIADPLLKGKSFVDKVMVGFFGLADLGSYSSFVIIAILTIIFVLVRWNHNEPPTGFVSRLSLSLLMGLTGTFFLFTVAYFLGIILFVGLVQLFRQLSPQTAELLVSVLPYPTVALQFYWLYRVIKWFRFTFSKRNISARLEDFTSFIRNLCLPVILIALVLVISVIDDYPGLASYYIGLNVLFFGYLQTAHTKANIDFRAKEKVAMQPQVISDKITES